MANLTRPYEVTDIDVADKAFYGFRINAAIWTKNTLQFSWDSTQKTHILMEIK